MPFLLCLCGEMPERRETGEAARLMVVRQRGGNYLSPDEVPELLDEELPQQLLASAFRKYSK